MRSIMSRQESLEDLHRAIRNCTKCDLHKTRKNAVPGEGPIDAHVMLVGEAPGKTEDETGRPFVGSSGKLLTDLLNKIGLPRGRVFVTSILKSRPPENRTPRKDEIEACILYLDRQIEIIQPDIIVLLGGVATSSLIGPWKISDAHGSFYEADGNTYFITYHPAAALRSPKVRSQIEMDFQLLMEELE